MWFIPCNRLSVAILRANSGRNVAISRALLPTTYLKIFFAYERRSLRESKGPTKPLRNCC